MSAEIFAMTERRRRAYLWGGSGLVALGVVCAALNAVLSVPEYQKVSWLLVGFYLVSGGAGVVAARVARSGASKVVETGEALVVAVLLAVVIRWGIVQAFKIPSGSMLPTLQIGDHLLVNKVLYGPRIPYTGARLFRLRPPKRGDVVVFAYPQDDTKDFIKRIIGEPGDTVEVRDKTVYINGAPLRDPWGVHADPIVYPEGFDKRDNFGPVKVSPGEYFCMGDNRDKSYDSRFWGFVEDSRIRGKAFVLYWSWDAEAFRPRLRRMGRIIR